MLRALPSLLKTFQVLTPIPPMQNTSHTHYQTSFVVTKETGNPFHELQVIILRWLQTKRDPELDWRLNHNRNEFFRKCEFSNLHGTHSKITTNTYYEKEATPSSNVWAIRYQHSDSKLGTRRFWYTDITLRERGQSVVFFARVSYAWNREDLGSEHSIPDTNVPGFIKQIINADFEVYSSQKTFCLKNIPLVVSRPGQGQPLATAIKSNDRKYPIVVVNGEDPELIEEAKYLAANLAGKCQVILIKENAELAEEIRLCLPKDLWIRLGTIRVFFSFNNRTANPRRHRYFNPQTNEYSTQRKGIINGLLRTHPLIEHDAVESVFEIDSLIRKLRFKEFISNHQDQKDELEPIIEELELILGEKKKLEESLQMSQQEAEEYAIMVDDLEKEKRGLESKIQALNPKHNLQKTQLAKIETVESMSSLPETLEDVAKWFGKAHSDKLILCHSAIESANDYEQFTELKEAWRMFNDIINVLWKMKFESSSKFEENSFNSHSRFTLSMTEGKNTKRDSSLMALRKVTHCGTEYDITPHIKWGTQMPRMLRINFAFDEEKQKIVVGYVGPHLDNATTKTLK